MYFDFEDRYERFEPVGSAINRRDGVALAVWVWVGVAVKVTGWPNTGAAGELVIASVGVALPTLKPTCAAEAEPFVLSPP